MNRKLYWFAAVIVAGSTVALVLLLSSPKRVHDSVAPVAAAQRNVGPIASIGQKMAVDRKRSGALPFAGNNDSGSRILALLSSSGPERSKGLDDAVQAWIAQDAVGAAEFGESQESASVREEMIHRVLEAWSRKDAKAALAWANDLPDPAKKQEAVSAICLTMAQSDPLKALDSALDSHAENAGDGLIESIAMQWAAKDPQAARQWAEAQDPGAWRDGVLGRIAFVLCRTNPAGAAQIVSSEMQPGQAQTEAAISVVHQWAQVDQASATAWVNGFPAELRKRALTEIANVQSKLY